MLVPQGPTDVVLSRHWRGLPPRSSESNIKPLSLFPSTILHLLTLSFLTQSQIKVLINFPKSIRSIEPPSLEGALSRVVFDHSTSTEVLNY
jgi:hypothetical protein